MAAVSPNSETLNVGDMFLTKYQIRGLIGRGGQATVYHGYDTFMDRDVAIKVMADAFDSKREHSRRAQMEARVLCKLQHPNIVHVYDAGSTDSGAIYIIMELLRGRTLREVLRDVRQLTVSEALTLGAQIADGVDVAHRQQVIHRDLKPENIFVVDGNTIKVLDFGIAKFLTLTGITTQTDTLHGTMWYISPEHVQGIGVTPRSDIYALGSILYEVIFGTPPCLVGLQEISTPAVAWSQISRVPPRIDELVAGVPSHVAVLIQSMLVKDPRERPSSMAEVAAALRMACAGLNAEVHRAPRDLWIGTQVRAIAPSHTLLGTGFDNTSSSSGHTNVMQPTIKIREAASRDSVSSNPGAGVGPQVVESGIVVANPAAASPTPSLVAPVEAIHVPTSDEIIPGRAANKPVMLTRRVLLLVAVAIGSLLGLGWGLLGRPSSKLGEVRGSPTASAAPLTESTRQPPSPALNSPIASVSTPPTVAPTGASAPLPSSSGKPSSATSGADSRVTPNSPVISPPAVRMPKKSGAGTTPQPRYSGADLE